MQLFAALQNYIHWMPLSPHFLCELYLRSWNTAGFTERHLFQPLGGKCCKLCRGGEMFCSCASLPAVAGGQPEAVLFSLT